ncbi:elongation factor 4 [Candidatus Uhrbacteria bacterium CG22_combo_CG10-13_8_21_14_all_47_17]|uniref:Elongation factor 4 n=1 Tax=Candidatus Uhrbacteria bacterium CG22_combo_CG10-13_8_21_14_all_47_17 TaxID=1975041 RepID=A0A2H0BUC3_9BACT|nr:MAG: elongation factor 4 [Candidatus Uhrbacteria bacterium CG22_combo_CG10-13_8_21_14_all_47_17]
MDQKLKRNFCIIAHIDHGKSTLSDRLLELTGTIEKRNMKEQLLDTMDLERERGITIKLQPARMNYKAKDGTAYELNLIDTPGHVDFTYEVSRSLAAVEGAVLLVDATQGVQAQTIANLYLAIEQDLVIIPVLNKIDLPNADVAARSAELMALIGCKREDIILASGKTGEGVTDILERIVADVPHPRGDVKKPFRAVIFDSKYNDYQGVVAYVRCMDGTLDKNTAVHFLATDATGTAIDVGYLKPDHVSSGHIEAGDIGFIVTGLKDIESVRVGDTIAREAEHALVEALPGYKEVRPMVYAGIFPQDGSEYEKLREAILKLKLNDASLTFEPEHSTALGFGFRCGLLGMLHLEIVQERLLREFDMDIVITTPSVGYEVTLTSQEEVLIKSPAEFPDSSRIQETREPWVITDILCPKEYVGSVMQLVQDRRGNYKNTEYLEAERAILHYDMPLASVIVDFYDKLKGATAGYASLNYNFTGFRPSKIVRLNIIVADEPVEALATLLHDTEAYRRGKEIVSILKEELPRQQFVVKIQATVGSKVVAAERVSAFRKDVTGDLYGGDATRKMKLLEKQKKGKKRMLEHGKGSVPIPPEAFIKVLRRG